MNTDLIIDIAYLIFFSVCVILSNHVVESWWSFLYGAVVALTARNVGKKLMEHFERRQRRRHRLN